MIDRSLPCDPASKSPARSRLVNRAWEPLRRAVRGSARWCRWNWHGRLPGWRTASSCSLRGPCGYYRLSGRAPGRCAALSSPPCSMTSIRRAGLLRHATVTALILVSGHAAAYHDHIWCLGGARFVDMTDCVVWEDKNKFYYSVRNICNEYMNLTVCWTGHDFHDINYKCDKSHPIPPATWGGWEPGESGGLVDKGEFVWWAWRCEE